MESDDDKTRTHVVLTKGTMVAHYRIVEKIGAGGMGEVYLAEDTKLKRHLALKFMPAHSASDADMRERFTREAQATAKLDHPNIVTIFEVGEFNGRPFFAMEHVVGDTLGSLIKQRKLSTDESVRLTMQICEGLHKAHESRVVHRDIKPGNIIIDNDGRARILDFGLAMVSGEDKLTKTGSTLGTVGYMSPEQVSGKDVDHRSDLFSLGVILYEMLTGRRPFEGDNDAAIVNAIANSSPEPIARFKSGVTGELQQIVDKALTKDPSLRYQHADGMLADLKRLRVKTVPRKKGKLAPILISSLVVISVLVVLVLKPWRFEIQSTEEAIALENRLAIMYFDNLTDPGDSLKLGEISTNLLITDLSESEYVSVVSSQRLYDILKLLGKKGERRIDRDLATQVAQKARARWMLRGTILRSEPSLILTTEIVEVSTGVSISSKRIVGEPGQDIFPLIDALTIEVKKDLTLSPKALEETDPSIAGITTNSQEAYRLYLSAVDDFYNIRWVEMIESLDRCLDLDSTFAMAYLLLARRCQGEHRQGMIDRAVEYSNQASEKEQLYINAWKADYEQDFDLSLELMEQVIKRYPEEKEAHYWTGVTYYEKLGLLDKAIAAFRAAINLDPQFGPAHRYLAFVYFDLGDFENSHRSNDRYVEYSDSCASSLVSRGYLNGLVGNTDKAIASYLLAFKVELDFIPSLHQIGAIQAAMGEYAEAEKYFRRLILNRNYAVRSLGRLLIALIPIQQGRFVQALQVLDDGIAADKMEYTHFRTARKHLWKAAIYQARCEYDNATGEVNDALAMIQELLPEREIEFRYRSVELLADKGEFEGAVKAAEDFKSKTPGERKLLMARYWHALAYIEHARANYGQAVTYAEKACMNTLYTSEDFLRFHALLGRAYMDHGQMGDAVAEFEQIVNMYGKCRQACPVISIKVRYWLAQAYEESGWDDKAIEQYETFLDIWKNADSGLASVENAKERLTRLKSVP